MQSILQRHPSEDKRAGTHPIGKGAGVMNSWMRQITGAKSNSLNPSYVRGMTQKFGNKIWLRLKAA